MLTPLGFILFLKICLNPKGKKKNLSTSILCLMTKWITEK